MKYDLIVAGAGIIGLSTAFQWQKTNPGKKVLVLDKESDIGKHQSGNNSGVIHSGIYYPPKSLKAKNCLRGYELLLEFCKEQEVSHEICGKVIVATNEKELPALQKIKSRGEENGLKGLRDLDKGELAEIEPHLAGIKGIFVPQTGIVDYKGMMRKLKEIIISKEGEVQTGQKIIRLQNSSDGIRVGTDSNEFNGDRFVNCGGLYSDKIARLSGIDPGVKIIPFRGEYFKLKEEKKYLVKNLIYPVPDPAFPFLGVHFTRMVGGEIEAGPNAVLAYAREGYTKSKVVIPELLESLSWPGFQKVAAKYWKTGMGELYRSYSKKAFTKALQKLIPEIREEDLVPGGAGVRAQACDRKGGLLDDFKIEEKGAMTHVLNAPSPAATSSLAIGEFIAAKLNS